MFFERTHLPLAVRSFNIAVSSDPDSRPTIAIATSEKLHAARADAPLLLALEKRGFVAKPLPWKDPASPWDQCRMCIVRSTWDWHLHPEEFRAWILRTAARTRLVNTAKTLLWGLDKRYLLALQASGLPIVPTAVLDHADEIPSIAAERGWSRVVVKPVLGASAFQVRLIDLSERVSHEQAPAGGTVLVQPFLEEVCRDGEISVVVIGGRAMHAVRKRPAPGDFRVQVEHGGGEEEVPLDGDLRRLAEACWAAVPGQPTYTRIDIIVTPFGPRIIECEVVEPELFLDRFPEAASALAEAVCSQLTDSGCVHR